MHCTICKKKSHADHHHTLLHCWTMFMDVTQNLKSTAIKKITLRIVIWLDIVGIGYYSTLWPTFLWRGRSGRKRRYGIRHTDSDTHTGYIYQLIAKLAWVDADHMHLLERSYYLAPCRYYVNLFPNVSYEVNLCNEQSVKYLTGSWLT
mgnify:CR=1 FL=1